MSVLPHELPRASVDAKVIDLVKRFCVGLGVFLSGFVVREPAPYELYMACLMAVWAFCGLRVSRWVMPLLLLLVLFNIGGMISMTQAPNLHERDIPLYLLVSLFLAFTAVFFAAVTERQPGLLEVAFKAWIAAAVLTSILGICGFFHAFPGAEMFTLNSRAAGAFQDPNVFGPFLALPGVYLLYRILTDRPSRTLVHLLPLVVIAAGIFFSFSRGAWGLFCLSSIMIVLAIFLQTGSGALRLRIVVMSIAAVVLLVLLLLAFLHIPGVDEFFLMRAHIAQDYDSARLGRFARYTIGFGMAISRPFGIGPLEFGQIFGEDTHDIWLKTLMDYSWLGFASYLTLIIWTVAGAFRFLLRDRPWQPYLLCAYVVLIGHTALGTVIDTDHWRHFYILLGFIWGCMALEQRHQSGLAVASPPRPAPDQYVRNHSNRRLALTDRLP